MSMIGIDIEASIDSLSEYEISKFNEIIRAQNNGEKDKAESLRAQRLETILSDRERENLVVYMAYLDSDRIIVDKNPPKIPILSIYNAQRSVDDSFERSRYQSANSSFERSRYQSANNSFERSKTPPSPHTLAQQKGVNAHPEKYRDINDPGPENSDETDRKCCIM